MPPVKIEVGRREAGQTVAAILKTRLGLSWSQAKRLVERHHVRYAGQIIGDPAHRLKAGKLITVASGAIESKVGTKKHKPAPAPTPYKSAATVPAVKPVAATQHPIQILYADESIVVVVKPAGLTTHRDAKEVAEFGERGRRFLPKTLTELLPGLLGEPGRPIFAVHRIDRDTSGIVVFARTPAAAKKLTAQFRKHTANRRYLAIVRGTPAAGRLESVLVRDRGDGRRGSSTNFNVDGGKHAVTHVTVRQQFAGFALVECRLETGRTHQVRIHLGEAGTPLCGERVYDRSLNGRPLPDESGAARPMLHAAQLGIDHPDTGERMIWESPPPQDFTQVLTRIASNQH